MSDISLVRNFIINIRPVMLKLKQGFSLTKEEREQVIQFYIEISTWFNTSDI
jgi:hypothetical protein